VRERLEAGVGSIWVAGEISNLRAQPSGHVYFTLKDDRSQLAAVMFRSAAQVLTFRPDDGMEVLVSGRMSLYPARGALQLYVDMMEPRGLGALQLAFEQLKIRLGAEGLFAADRKRPLPRFPRAVGIVTALQGAAIHDMRTVLRKRWPACRIVVRPVRVQGAGAGREVAAGIEDLNRLGGLDALIVGRAAGRSRTSGRSRGGGRARSRRRSCPSCRRSATRSTSRSPTSSPTPAPRRRPPRPR